MKQKLLYGLIVGLCVATFVSIFSVFFWANIRYSWGLQASNVRGLGGLMTILIQGIGIFISIKKVRTTLGGTISYGQAFKTGFTIAIMTALITSCASILYCTVINPGYQDFMIADALKTMQANHETPQQINMHLEAVRNEFSTKTQFTEALIGQFVMGTAISLILAPFMRGKTMAASA